MWRIAVGTLLGGAAGYALALAVLVVPAVFGIELTTLDWGFFWVLVSTCVGVVVGAVLGARRYRRQRMLS